MNLLLLCVCSIFLARFLEGKMKVASIAHSVLFIFMGVYFLFTSENYWINFAMNNLVGEYYYNVFHDAFIEAAQVYTITMITLFVTEFIICSITALLAMRLLIKGIRYLLSKGRNNKSFIKVFFNIGQNNEANHASLSNKQNTYLVFSQLRN